MKRLLKAGSILAVAVLCTGLLTGCGETLAKYKIGKEGRYYVANKYGPLTPSPRDHIGDKP